MSLVKCPECGNAISSLCKACPRCGYPLAEDDPSTLIPVNPTWEIQNSEGYNPSRQIPSMQHQEKSGQLTETASGILEKIRDKSAILGIAAAAILILLIIGVAGNQQNQQSSQKSTGTSGYTEKKSSMDYNTACRLYLNISDVEIEHNSSYTIATGKVTNTSSQYSMKFIKVKGAFQDYSGNTIDTDWTYVVGDEFLDPGESSSFRISVPLDRNIKTCKVTVMTD